MEYQELQDGVLKMEINGNDASRTALVVYATETGNSQEIAEELGRIAERLHFETHVLELDAVKAVSSRTGLFLDPAFT